jgi:SNF2 family DNA or RNA helicase
MYRQFLSSKVARQAFNGGKQSMVLESINSLRKLVNHPSLILDNGKAAKGFEEAVHLLPEETISDRRKGGKPVFHPSLGGKMMVRFPYTNWFTGINIPPG